MDISVVVPTFKRRELTFEAVDSILRQSFKVDEIVVVEDGSCECRDIKKFDALVKYIYQENRGVAAARNHGIKEAKNEWIAFLDSDDLWLPDKLKEQVDSMSKTKKLVSITDEVWSRDGRVVKKPKEQSKSRSDIFKASLERTFLPPSSVLIHRTVLEDVGFFDEEFVVCEDYELWLRIVSKYEVDVVQKELVVKRAGEWEALSKRALLDIWRVKALEKNIESFSDEQKNLALKELERKTEIIKKGAKKRGKSYEEIVKTRLLQ